MSSLERYWFGPVALARPYLVVRFVLVVLAFDTWLNMIPQGATYGAAGFNVPHFPWFDGFVPSSGFYVGALAFTGVLALSQALYRPHRIAIFFIAVGYTLGWSCSLLDSVAYHYLLSLYLLCFAFFPMLSARAAFSRSHQAPKGSAWAYVLFCVTTATVYFYVAAWAAAEGRSYWLPMLCCVAYLVATMQDRSKLPGLRLAIPAVGLAPVVFHLAAPGQDWLAAYMIGIALIVFAPETALHQAGQLLTRPARNLADEPVSGGLDERASRLFYASLLGLIVAPMVSMFIDLPGVKTGCTLTAIAMLLVMGRQLYLTPRWRPVWRVTSLLGGCLALWIAMTASGVQFDYYRRAALDADQRGDHDTALRLREKAERHAP